MATILVTYGMPDDGFEALAGHRIVRPEPLKHFTKEELLAKIPEADAVLGASKMDADVIRAAKNVKIIANYGAGYDSIDVRTAAEAGIPVTNIPETVTEATAELAIGLTMAVLRRIGEKNLRMRTEGPESQFGMYFEMGRNLKGSVMGVIGVGRIGRRTAELARALGMETVGYSRHGAPADVVRPVPLDELLAVSDVVSLNCPLTEETRDLINAETIAKMKPGAVLINTSRGAVVDSDALADAIENGHLFGAGLDVFPDEPHVPERLMKLPNVVLTPHVGSNTAQTRRIMVEACVQQILDALAGKRPRSIVNGL